MAYLEFWKGGPLLFYNANVIVIHLFSLNVTFQCEFVNYSVNTFSELFEMGPGATPLYMHCTRVFLVVCFILLHFSLFVVSYLTRFVFLSYRVCHCVVSIIVINNLDKSCRPSEYVHYTVNTCIFVFCRLFTVICYNSPLLLAHLMGQYSFAR